MDFEHTSDVCEHPDTMGRLSDKDIETWVDSVASTVKHSSEGSPKPKLPRIHDIEYAMGTFEHHGEKFMAPELRKFISKLNWIMAFALFDAKGVFPYMKEGKQRKTILSLGFREAAICAQGETPSHPLLLRNDPSIRKNIKKKRCSIEEIVLSIDRTVVQMEVLRQAFRCEEFSTQETYKPRRSDFALCPSAKLTREYLSCMPNCGFAEFYITLPAANCAQLHKMGQASEQLEFPIKHIDGSRDIDRCVIALPVKTTSEQQDRYTCIHYMSRLLVAQRMWLDEPVEMSRSPAAFLLGIIVDGDTWYLCALVPRPDKADVLLADYRIGGTASLADTYKLMMCLKEVRAWVEKVYRPFVMKHMFNITE